MLNNFIYAKQKSLFEEKLNNGEVLDEAIVFIEDTKEIWNHGTYFDGNAVDLASIIASIEQQLVWEKAEGEAGIRLKGTNGTATGASSISAGDDKIASDGTEYKSVASGDHAVAFGYGNTCSGRTTLAQGFYNIVNGKDSVAFGQRNLVDGDQAFAAGQQNEVATRLGIALGYQNKTTNIDSIAIGYKNTSGGSGSIALGDTCESLGTSSTAMGYKTKATGSYSSTFGESTQATNGGEVSMGSYNKSTTSTNTAEQTSFSFGIGTSDTNRINAFEIKKNGDVYIGDKLLSNVATSGSYNDLTDKPTIPSEVTESTVSGWGFTKNTGTYSKPSTGIPKTDLASAVQTSLNKADTALQSYTEQYKGTVTGVKINGTTKSPSSGVVDLGTVITSHQTLKTINGESIVGEGDLSIQSANIVTLNIGSLPTQNSSVTVNLTEEQLIMLKSYDTVIKLTFNYLNKPHICTMFHTINTVTHVYSGVAYTVKNSVNYDTTRRYVYGQFSSSVSNTITFTISDIIVTESDVKTINGQSLIGSGDIVIEGGVTEEYVNNAISSAITTTLNTEV